MTTASTLMATLQTELGDPDGTKFTSAILYGWLDEAQKEWCKRLMPLIQVDGTSVAANQDSLALPSDAVMVEVMATRKGFRHGAMKRVTREEFVKARDAVPGAVATDPVIWTEIDGRIYVYPRYSGASLTTTVNASTTTTAATITLASTGNLRNAGRVEIDSEEIEYTGKTATTITGARRGLAGTTAATHVSAATVTQIDLEVMYRRVPVALASTASPEIRSPFHEDLKIYAKYLAYMLEGSFDKAQAAYGLWDRAIANGEYQARREHLSHMRVVNVLDSQSEAIYGY